MAGESGSSPLHGGAAARSRGSPCRKRPARHRTIPPRSTEVPASGPGRPLPAFIIVSDVLFDQFRHQTWAELTAGLEEIRRSPPDDGVLEMIVRRPRPGARESVAEAELSDTEGLVGDRWRVECAPTADPRDF